MQSKAVGICLLVTKLFNVLQEAQKNRPDTLHDEVMANLKEGTEKKKSKFGGKHKNKPFKGSEHKKKGFLENKI